MLKNFASEKLQVVKNPGWPWWNQWVFLGIFQRFPRIRGCKVLAVNLVRTSAAGAPEIDSVDPRISDFLKPKYGEFSTAGIGRCS